MISCRDVKESTVWNELRYPDVAEIPSLSRGGINHGGVHEEGIGVVRIGLIIELDSIRIRHNVLTDEMCRWAELLESGSKCCEICDGLSEIDKLFITFGWMALMSGLWKALAKQDV